MLINLRNALMAGKRLPYDAEVEFLESSGTQYINTGIMGASEWHITAQGAATPTTSNCVIATTSSGGSFWGNYGNVNYWAVGNGSSWRCSLPYTSIGSFIVTFSASYVQFTVNGETVTRSSAPNFSKAFCLFSTNGDGYGATVRVYGCKVYQNGVLVRDYIPVRVGTTGELYDRVSGKFAERHGDFVLGQDVAPVEYIESTGTQRILTDIYTDANTVINCKASGTSGSFFGVLPSSNTAWWTILPNDSGKLRYYYGGSGATVVATIDATVPHDYQCSNKVLVDGVEAISLSRTLGSANVPLSLFARTTSSGTSFTSLLVGRMWYLQIIQSGATVRSFRPIRVGTDATSWEGAMMDVLTRRVYRNAGTGAFTYGNDLPYPIPAS